MAYLTLAQLEDLFYTATRDITGLAATAVRIAYQTTGQPSWEVSQNVVLINIQQVNNSYDKQLDYKYVNGSTNSSESVFYHRVMAVDWNCYGPNSFQLADALRIGILSDSVRNNLYLNEVFPIPRIDSPIRVPYLFNGQWYERQDLRVLFNVGTTRTGTVPLLTAANIQVKTRNETQSIDIP